MLLPGTEEADNFNDTDSESSESDSESEDEASYLIELVTPDQDEVIENGTPYPAVCLFCDYKHESAHNLVLVHFKDVHELVLLDWIAKFRMGHLQYIKMVNYFRKMKSTFVVPDTIKSISDGTMSPPWCFDEYLSVVDENDSLLCVSLVEFIESDDEETLNATCMGARGMDVHEHCKELCNSMRDVILRVMEEGNDESLKKTIPSASKSSLVNHCSDDTSGYFESYDDVGIHASMLNDFPRTDAYRRAIQEGGICKEKSVLDVGCGTGILSLFAAQAGASYVCAIDQSDIIIDTIDIVHENKLENIIKCVKGSVENYSPPAGGIEKFDVIVSEWMGYFLLFEGMLNSFMCARDSFLKKDGILIPNQSSMYIAGVSDTDFRKSHLDMWDDVYGFKMSTMKRKATRQAQIVLVEPKCMATDSFEILKLNLYNCTPEDAIIDQDFALKLNRSCILTALVGFFDVVLSSHSNCVAIKLGTGPYEHPTHWKQCVFLLPEGISLEEGKVLNGNIKVSPNRENKRWLDVTIRIHEPKMRFTYTLN